jgi:hypothetical protein
MKPLLRIPHPPGGRVLLYTIRVDGVNVMPSATLELPNLDGDRDEEYEIKIDAISSAAATSNVMLRPNGGSGFSTANVRGLATTASADNANGYGFTQRRGAWSALVRFYARSGRRRTWLTSCGGASETHAAADNWHGFGHWNNTTDSLTSLSVQTGQANGFDVGSVVSVYRVIR